MNGTISSGCMPINLYYLNNRMFLSTNYRLIVALRKFDVLKTNICLRSEYVFGQIWVRWKPFHTFLVYLGGIGGTLGLAMDI